MASRTPSLDEAMRRRKRQMLPRTPEKTLGQRLEELKSPDEKLELLLKELLYLAERETIFSMTLERGRLMSALVYAGWMATALLNTEHQMAPGATVTSYMAVAPGFVYIPAEIDAYNSLPWWLTISAWYDTDVPALPWTVMVRAPEQLHMTIEGIFPLFRFFRYTTTNNHALNTANFIMMHNFGIVTETVWKMIEEVYFKPIIEYVRETAEKRTGRPFP